MLVIAFSTQTLYLCRTRGLLPSNERLHDDALWYNESSSSERNFQVRTSWFPTGFQFKLHCVVINMDLPSNSGKQQTIMFGSLLDKLNQHSEVPSSKSTEVSMYTGVTQKARKQKGTFRDTEIEQKCNIQNFKGKDRGKTLIRERMEINIEGRQVRLRFFFLYFIYLFLF